MITEVAVTEGGNATSYAALVPSTQNAQSALANLVHQLLLDAPSANPIVVFGQSGITPIRREDVTSVTVTWG